jgi:ribosomal-protein-alanine N-acetyltransferase
MQTNSDAQFSQEDWQSLKTWLPLLKSPSFSWTTESLADLFPRARLRLLRTQNGKLCSFIIYQKLADICEILVLATHPDLRRQGHMERLLGGLIAGRQVAGELWLEVHEGNLGARKLYEKLGFKLSGRRPSYYKDGAAALLFTLTP